MTEFWEASFQEKKAMWGEFPTDAAIRAAELFKARAYKNVLIPGIGYGRNAKPFIGAGIPVTGIEISETAIAMAQAGFGSEIRIFHGSVAEMPFEDKQYDSIFSFALIHLLNETDRQKFIAACYNHLRPGGTMIFLSIAESAPMFGTGKKITDRLFETMPGVRLFFYDAQSIGREFGDYGLEGFQQVSEPAKNTPTLPDLDFLWIECRKKIQT